MLGSVNTWFYKTLAGINIDSEHPGFQKIIVKPEIVDDLKHVTASIKTIRGIVSSRWYRDEKSLTVEVTIPANSTAEVYVPIKNFNNPVVKESNIVVWKDNRFVEGAIGITSGKRVNHNIVFDIGSGSYTFLVEERKE